MIHTILSQRNVVVLSVYTTEPNTSHQNHQLSLKKRNIYHQYLFQTDILCPFLRKLTKTTRPTANKKAYAGI